MSKLLPENFDYLLRDAVKKFWNSRDSIAISQQGGRGAVIGGKNLDGFSDLIKAIAKYNGFGDESVITSGKKSLTIPGYFRPTKMWDAIIIYKGRLIAAFELKSQVGSFGNNFNNRTEESIGSAKDFWTAFRENAFDVSNFTKEILFTNPNDDVKPPFLGYLMFLEECDGSTRPVRNEESNYKVFSEFQTTSYAQRYKIMCEKLIKEGLYSSGCLILSKKESGKLNGDYSTLSKDLSPNSLFADFAAKLQASKEVL